MTISEHKMRSLGGPKISATIFSNHGMLLFFNVHIEFISLIKDYIVSLISGTMLCSTYLD